MKQLSLIARSPLFHGGTLAHGRRKKLRPLSRKRPLHLVLKTKCSLYPHRARITGEVQRLARRFGLRVYGQAIGDDHVHLILRIPGRREYVGFIRSLTGLLARMLGRGLWILLPFSRVCQWGRDFARLKAYLQKNREEAAGLRPYEQRQDWYRRWKRAEFRHPTRLEE